MSLQLSAGTMMDGSVISVIFFIHGAAPSHIYSVNFTAFSIIPRQATKINSYFKKTTYYLIAVPHFVS